MIVKLLRKVIFVLVVIQAVSADDDKSGGFSKSGSKKDGNFSSTDKEDDDSKSEKSSGGKKKIEIDLLKVFGEAVEWIQSDEFQQGIGKAIENFTSNFDIELNNWEKEYWQDRWVEDSGDRWDIANKELGWSLEEVK